MSDKSDLSLRLPSIPSAPPGNFSTELEKIDRRGRSAGSRRTQFKRGAEWKGNRGGRPRIIKEETAAWLEERDESGKTNASKMVETLGKLALTEGPQTVAAFREIRNTIESVQNEQAGGHACPVDPLLLALMQKIEVEE